MDFSTLRLGGRSACPVPVSLVRAPVRGRFRMSVTCPGISTPELAGHPARSINHSLFLQWYGHDRKTASRSPSALHFRPFGIQSHGEHVPRHLARKEQIRSSTAGPYRSRRRIADDPERQQKRNGGKIPSFVPFVRSSFVRYVSEQRQPGLLRARPGLVAIFGALISGQTTKGMEKGTVKNRPFVGM